MDSLGLTMFLGFSAGLFIIYLQEFHKFNNKKNKRCCYRLNRNLMIKENCHYCPKCGANIDNILKKENI